MLGTDRPTAAEMRVLCADAAKVREQNEDRQARSLPRLTWTPPTVEAVEPVEVEADDQVAVAS